MEQHPIPQQITSYQFRLVGDMTLKQFFQLAGGIIVGLIFYSTPLHPLIKWPLIFFFVLLGVALAFLPFEDRPLENWILAFFRSVYAPTVYNWRKTTSAPSFYRDEMVVPEPTLTGVSPEKLTAYLADTDAQKPSFSKKLEGYEKNFLAGVGGLFGGVHTQQAAQVPQVSATPIAIPLPETKTAPVPTPKPAGEQIVSSLNIPQAAPANISAIPSKGLSATQGVEFSEQASPPIPPTVPNTIAGQTLDSGGKIVEAAILEIRDAGGRPVRALRTNKLGHFMVVTPLISGPYEIVTEKEGYAFDPVRFDAVGELIAPIVIRATNPQIPLTS